MELINQILLVDDDNAINLHHERLIKESGLCKNVKITLNGGHAFLYLCQKYSNYNSNTKLLILLDMDMPIMNGYDFLNSYNSCTFINKENIFIALMTDTPENELLDMKALGVSYFVSKPLSAHRLRTILQEKLTLKIAS